MPASTTARASSSTDPEGSVVVVVVVDVVVDELVVVVASAVVLVVVSAVVEEEGVSELSVGTASVPPLQAETTTKNAAAANLTRIPGTVTAADRQGWRPSRE
jgi:hypothetical protein